MSLHPKALPIDEDEVLDLCDRITSLNRSERRIIHAHVLDVSRSANDRSVSNNANVLACRMTLAETHAIASWCRDHLCTLSDFTRDAVRAHLKRVTRDQV